MTASIGVVEFQPAANRESVSVESLIGELDANLYQSKQNGRNRVTLPASPASAPALPAAAPATAPQRPPHSILHVDDEPERRLTVAAEPSRGDATDRARLREQIARQAGKFLQRCEAQAVTLRGLVEDLQASDTRGLSSMREIAHTIHGSGAMFNLPAVSECAGEIERLSQSLLATDSSSDWAPQSPIRQRLQACIRQLAQAIESARALHGR